MQLCLSLSSALYVAVQMLCLFVTSTTTTAHWDQRGQRQETSPRSTVSCWSNGLWGWDQSIDMAAGWAGWHLGSDFPHWGCREGFGCYSKYWLIWHHHGYWATSFWHLSGQKYGWEHTHMTSAQFSDTLTPSFDLVWYWYTITGKICMRCSWWHHSCKLIWSQSRRKNKEITAMHESRNPPSPSHHLPPLNHCWQPILWKLVSLMS